MDKMSQKSYSPFFLVLWKGENKYSCVARDNIVDGSKRKECDSKLLTYESLEISFNRHIYVGKILFAGATKKNVNSYMKDAEPSSDPILNTNENSEFPAQKRKRFDKAFEISEILNHREELNSESNPGSSTIVNEPELIDPNSIQINSSPGDDGEVDQERKLDKLKKKVAKLKEKLEASERSLHDEKLLTKKYKGNVTRLRGKLNKFQANKTTMVDIGKGVMINAALLDRAKLFSNTPAILARNVFRLAFQESEIRGKSLFGRQCNANKALPAKPSIDETKRDAILEFCIQSLTEDARRSGLTQDKISIRNKIVKSLGEYIREVNSKTVPAPCNSDSEN